MDIIDPKLIEDRIYKIGEISQATGLQKTANGWVKPRTGKAPGAKTGPGKKEIKTIPFNPKELEYVDADGTKQKFTPEEMLTELNEMKAEEQKAGKDTTRIEGEIKGLKEYIKTQKKPTTSAGVSLSRKEKEDAIYKDIGLTEGDFEKMSDEEVNRLYEKTKGESKPAESKPKLPKPSMQEYMKAKKDLADYEKAYKKQKEDYDYTQRVKANGGDVSLMFPMNVKPKELTENPDYMKAKETISAFEANDAAPKCITGDCKIRVKKTK